MFDTYCSLNCILVSSAEGSECLRWCRIGLLWRSSGVFPRLFSSISGSVSRYSQQLLPYLVLAVIPRDCETHTSITPNGLKCIIMN